MAMLRVNSKQTSNTNLQHYHQQLLNQTNSLLELVGFSSKTFLYMHDLIKNIIRVPKSRSDYSKNAQQVINELRTKHNQSNLRDLTGDMVSAGNLQAIQKLVQTYLSLAVQQLPENKTKSSAQEGSALPSKEEPTTRSSAIEKKEEDPDAESGLPPAPVRFSYHEDEPSFDFGSVSSVSDIHSGDERKTKVKTRDLKVEKIHPKNKKTKSKLYQKPNIEEDLNQRKYKLVLKEHLHDLRQRELQSKKRMERQMNAQKYRSHLEKIRSARQHYDLRLQRISLGLQQKREQEKNLQSVMKYMLHLEKEKLREEHRKTGTILSQIEHEHKVKAESMENFYQDQMDMIKEKVQQETHDREIMEQAHLMASHQLLRELQLDREREVAAMAQKQQHLMEVKLARKSPEIKTLMMMKKKKSKASRKNPVHAAAVYARETKARAKLAQVARIYSR